MCKSEILNIDECYVMYLQFLLQVCFYALEVLLCFGAVVNNNNNFF